MHLKTLLELKHVIIKQHASVGLDYHFVLSLNKGLRYEYIIQEKALCPSPFSESKTALDSTNVYGTRLVGVFAKGTIFVGTMSKAPYSSNIDIFFFIKERFSKLIYSINMIINCGF